MTKEEWCRIGTCGRPVYAKDLCRNHYNRWQDAGAPDGWEPPVPPEGAVTLNELAGLLGVPLTTLMRDRRSVPGRTYIEYGRNKVWFTREEQAQLLLEFLVRPWSPVVGWLRASIQEAADAGDPVVSMANLVARLRLVSTAEAYEEDR